MGVSCVPLSISGREDGVNKNKGPDDLSTKGITLGVAMSHGVSSTTQELIGSFTLKALHNTSPTDGTKALHHYVENCPG